MALIDPEARETGCFTLLAEAESVDDAGEQFRGLIESLGSWLTAFDYVSEVFLEDITEVRRLPSTGVLAHVHMHPEDQHSHIATGLPGARRSSAGPTCGARKRETATEKAYPWNRSSRPSDGATTAPRHSNRPFTFSASVSARRLAMPGS